MNVWRTRHLQAFKTMRIETCDSYNNDESPEASKIPYLWYYVYHICISTGQESAGNLTESDTQIMKSKHWCWMPLCLPMDAQIACVGL